MKLAVFIVALLLTMLFASVALVRILFSPRSRQQYANSVADIEELDRLLAEGRLTPEEHQRLLQRCMERRAEAGIIGEPRGFDVQQPKED